MLLTFLFSWILVSKDSTPPITGKKPLDFLHNKSEFTWFDKGFESYTPKKETVEALKKVNWKDVKVKVFGGTWCEDTQNLLPKFIKMCKASAIPESSIELYYLDRKKQSPEGDEKPYNIERIPTFIILINGIEKGRVVESVSQSIEEDVLKIIQAK